MENINMVKPTNSIQPAAESPSPPAPQRRKGRRRLVIFAILFAAILTVAVVCLHESKSVRQSTDDAYVHGNQIFLTPRITGTVVAINADDTDLVRKGEPVIVLDDSDAKVSLQQAEAALGDTMRKVRQFYANVAQFSANVVANKIALQKAEDDYNRRTSVHDGAVSVENITHAQQAVDIARATLQAAEQQLLRAQALVANVDLQHHPMVLQAEARLLDAELTLLRTTIEAPATGYVTHRTIQVGQRVTPGAPLLAIIPLDQIWVDANYKEEQLRNVRIGQPVTLTSDFYGDSVKYTGHVVGLDPGTGAAFSLLPPDEGSGNWIKIIQRVPVRIILDKKQLEKFPLRIGLSMRVVIVTSDRSGAILAQMSSPQAVYATGIYSNEWAKANELVQGLVAANLQAVANLTSQASAAANPAGSQAGVVHE